MTRSDLCQNCGHSLTSHTGSYCQNCGTPIVVPQLKPDVRILTMDEDEAQVVAFALLLVADAEGDDSFQGFEDYPGIADRILKRAAETTFKGIQ